MLKGESSPTPFKDTPLGVAVRREFELAVREVALKRREEALRGVQQKEALPRVDARYFDPGHNAHEDDWWAKQFGKR